MNWFAGRSGHPPWVIGMLHLPPLPGAPAYEGDPRAVRDAALRDAEHLAAGGVDGLLLENFGDAPFYPDRVPAFVGAHLTAIACEVRRRFDLPLGINVLRNDALTALAVAHAADATFIRVNVLCGARLTDQGLLQGPAHALLRARREIGAERVRILADVAVKHSAPLAERPLSEEARETLQRGRADGLIVTGPRTGRAPQPEDLATLREACGEAPLLVGSGVDAENVEQFAAGADGLIVGSAWKHGGLTTNAVDPRRVRELMGRLGR